MKASWTFSRAATMVLGCVVVLAAGVATARADSYDSLVRKGTRLVKQNRLDKALGVFKAAVKADPNESWGYFNVGNIAQKVGKCRDVILYFRGFLYLSPGTGDDKIARKGIKKCVKSAKTGRLSVEADPPGAEVLLDGVVVAQAPESGLDLAGGKYVMELRHPDCREYRSDIEIKAGEATKIDEKLVLKPAFGFLEVKVDPAEGVKVYLDEKEVGVTPFDELRLETRKYLLRLEKAGYDRWVRYVTIRKDRTYKLQATMERLEDMEPPPADR